MLNPISEATQKLFAPINFAPTDRLAISLADGKKEGEEQTNTSWFNINIYGRSISQYQYRNEKNYLYSCNSIDSIDPTTKQKVWKSVYFARPSRYATQDFIMRIPEHKSLYDAGNYRGERFLVAATDITAALIYKLWMEPYKDESEKRVHFTEDAEIVFNYLLLTCDRMSKNAETIGRYKTQKEIVDKYKHNGYSVETNDDFSDFDKSLHLADLEKQLIPEQVVNELQYCADRPLAPHQQISLYLQYNNEGFADFSEQGCGKTPTLVATIDNLALQKYNDCQRDGKAFTPLMVLIVAPNNVRSNWEREIQNFSTVEGRTTIISGPEMTRRKLLIEAISNITDEKYIVMICGYGICHNYLINSTIEWDVVCADEIHYAKDPNTLRWKEGLSKLRDKSKHRYALTGTPVCNSINDLYTLLEFVRKGGSGFSSFKAFQSFYNVFDEFSRKVGYQNLPFIQERLSQMSFRITKREAMPDLPEKVYDVIDVEMTPYQTNVYEKIANELQWKFEQELANCDESNYAMTVNNILTQMLRLAQITSGFITYDAVYSDSGELLRPKQIERFEKQPKLDAVIEILQARDPKEKTLIWACWESDLEALQERIEFHGIKTVLFYGKTPEKKRKEYEYLFNHDDSYTVFIGNAAAGGTGLNLLGYPPGNPDASEMNVTQEIFFSQNWSHVYRAQSEDRAHRRGTRTNVRIIDLQVRNTIDTMIRKRVTEKKDMAMEITDLRKLLSDIVGNLSNLNNGE